MIILNLYSSLYGYKRQMKEFNAYKNLKNELFEFKST